MRPARFQCSTVPNFTDFEKYAHRNASRQAEDSLAKIGESVNE